MNRISALRSVFLAGLLVAGRAALANDTELTYSGTPRPLNGNTTVSMEREYVKMVIGEKTVTVDCRFTFHNRGPARKVRIGFPDEGGDPGQEIDPKTGKPFPPTPAISRFESWVNGRKVKTTAIPAAEDGSFWHVKRVDFPANSTLEVRDRYTTPVGNSVAYWPHSVKLAKYVLRTGASWRGNIGRSEVEVVFQRKGTQTPLALKRIPPLDDLDTHKKFAESMTSGRRVVYFQGPCSPTATGKTLRFVRTSWRPTAKVDILLVFDIKGHRRKDQTRR